MAEIVVGILGPLLGKLGDDLVNLIKKQVNYLCCYSCNVRELRDEVSQLETDKESVIDKIEHARAKWGVIRLTPEVQAWLSDIDEIEEKSSRICNDAEIVQKSCLSTWCPFLHYSLSREAQKTTKDSVELRKRRPTFEEVANPVNAADLEPIPVASERFESRESLEKKIMDALKKKYVYLIGIHGMPGVGKTTMVENIEKRVRKKTADSGSAFEKVIMAVVSQQPDLSKIQQKIAERLGLKLEEESLEIRAERLHASLKNAKSVLIILDDVWERLDLKKIGIPAQSTHPGCKLILTSRDRQAFNLTENRDIFQLEVLSEQESWILFREHAGSSIDSPDLYQVAKDVLEECKKLPLAIVTVGDALRDKGKASWQNARSQMQRPIPEYIPPVLKDVYGPLSWSFNRLEGEEYRYLFLLCCLFPEDSEISLEILVRYGMGLGILKGIKNLAEARDRVKSIVDDLISCSLLIKTTDKWGNLNVKMHDVIRDMGICFAPEWKHAFMVSHGKQEWPNKEEGSKSDEDYTGISLIFSRSDIDVPECIDYPRLELLHIRSSGFRGLKIPNNFFTGMKEFKVFEAFHIVSLPSSINLLNNLRTLYLSRCKLGKISMIGELIKLQILCLQNCDFIEVLPKEIGKLEKLKKLDVTGCSKLRRIESGVVSGLDGLEELTIVGSFKEWEAEEINNNASLVELDSLSHLTTLCIEISNPNAIPERKPNWVDKVKKYSVSVGGNSREITDLLLRFQNFILLGDKVVTPLRDWFYDHMVRDAQCLDLNGSTCSDVVNRLIRSRHQNLTCFKLRKCHNVKFLSDTSNEGLENGAIFPALKTLVIEDSHGLEEICNGLPPPGSFKELEEIKLVNLSRFKHLWTFSRERLYLSNLKLVRIQHCQSLLYLFPQSTAESLLQLEELEVSNCPKMKEIFKKEEGEIETMINKIKFPKLYQLRLRNLPSLQDFCKGIDGIEVLALRGLEITNLATNMREGDYDVQKQFLFDQKVGDNRLQVHALFTPLSFFNLSGLRALAVEGLHNFKSLFSPSALGSLQNLGWLCVRNCSKLEEVIGKEENVVGETKTKTVVFSQLWRLKLEDLPQILAFSQSMGNLEFPSLKDVEIRNCPMMETFCHSMGNLELPSLQELKIIDCHMMETFVKPLSNMSVPELVNQSLFRKEVADNRLQVHAMFTPLSFFNLSGLKELVVVGLHNFKSLFSPSTLGSLQNLEWLCVRNCSKLEEVIGKEENVVGETKTKTVVFSQLWGLELTNLPNLLAFSQSMGYLEFPSLKEVGIQNCPLMKTFVKPLSNVSISEHVNQHLFSKEISCPKLWKLQLEKLNVAGIFSDNISIDNFCQLYHLSITSCGRMTNLFSPPISKGLTNIKSLSLIDCEELQEVIATEDQETLTNIKETLFPQLGILQLKRLPKIHRFCHMKNDIELPSLEDVTIDDCPMLETFSLGSLRLPSFKRLHGLLDIDFAAKIFFNKEKSSHGIHLENDCVTISARDLSFNVKGRNFGWVLSPDSSGSFVIAAELRYVDLLEIKGKLEMVKLRQGVACEIILIIFFQSKVGLPSGSLLFELTLPGGQSTQNQIGISRKMIRGEWVEILVGEFTRELDQIGELKFSLTLHMEHYFFGLLLIEGVKIQLKV